MREWRPQRGPNHDRQARLVPSLKRDGVSSRCAYRATTFLCVLVLRGSSDSSIGCLLLFASHSSVDTNKP